MKVLIIGSKGFIGQHCIDYFKSKKGFIVFGCDVIVDYNSDNYFLVDSTNSNFQRIFESNLFDVCINCSGAASVANSIQNPARDFDLNTKNVLSILDAIRTYTSECKFINLSSAAVYGNPVSLPIDESHISNPISPYGIHKKQSEEICTYFNKFYKIPTCSLRIFSAYGEGLKKQLFWDLARKSKQAAEVSLYGTGLESRDYIHVSDIVSIIDLVIEKGQFDGEVINVANGKEVFIKDAVEIFFNFYDKKKMYSFSGDGRSGDPINWVADVSIINNLGYNQAMSIQSGLQKYIAWLAEEQD